MIAWVNEPQDFPEYQASKHQKYQGCVAASAVLSPDLLLAAYAKGLFPWYRQEGLFYWFATDPRAVLLPEHLRINRTLTKQLRRYRYDVSVNQDFQAVINHCATVKRSQQSGSSWIDAEFERAYSALHHLGQAHSVECWLEENHQKQLIGGFYGVQIGQVFYGESMFSLRPSASQIAFAIAVPYLSQCGVRLIDCQQASPHMMRFGARLIPFTLFRAQLARLNGAPLTHLLTTARILV